MGELQSEWEWGVGVEESPGMGKKSVCVSERLREREREWGENRILCWCSVLLYFSLSYTHSLSLFYTHAHLSLTHTLSLFATHTSKRTHSRHLSRSFYIHTHTHSLSHTNALTLASLSPSLTHTYFEMSLRYIIIIRSLRRILSSKMDVFSFEEMFH